MMKLNTQNALMSLVSGTSLLVISLAANAAPPIAKPAAAKPPVVAIAPKTAPAPQSKTVIVPKVGSKAKKHVRHVKHVKHAKHIKHVAARKTAKAGTKAHSRKG